MYVRTIPNEESSMVYKYRPPVGPSFCSSRSQFGLNNAADCSVCSSYVFFVSFWRYFFLDIGFYSFSIYRSDKKTPTSNSSGYLVFLPRTSNLSFFDLFRQNRRHVSAVRLATFATTRSQQSYFSEHQQQQQHNPDPPSTATSTASTLPCRMTTEEGVTPWTTTPWLRATTTTTTTTPSALGMVPSCWTASRLVSLAAAHQPVYPRTQCIASSLPSCFRDARFDG